MRRPWHSRAALLALLALTLQLMLPLWHMPAPNGAWAGTWLCTAQGLRQVPTGGPDQPAAPMPGKVCPVCAMAQAGTSGIVPQPPVLAVPVRYQIAVAAPAAYTPAPELAAPPPGSRAPPAA